MVFLLFFYIMLYAYYHVSIILHFQFLMWFLCHKWHIYMQSVSCFTQLVVINQKFMFTLYEVELINTHFKYIFYFKSQYFLQHINSFFMTLKFLLFFNVSFRQILSTIEINSLLYFL